MSKVVFYECECEKKSCMGLKRFHCPDGKAGMKGKPIEPPAYVKTLIEVAKVAK